MKDRRDEAMLNYGEIAQLANLPELVSNMLEGQTLHFLDPQGRHWLRVQDGLVYVPVTFGQVEVPLD